jgi:hypothetical protein
MIEYLSAETRILRETEEHLQAGALVFGLWSLVFVLVLSTSIDERRKHKALRPKPKDQKPKTKPICSTSIQMLFYFSTWMQLAAQQGCG